MKISLAVAVSSKQELDELKACLKSVADFAQEIVLFDLTRGACSFESFSFLFKLKIIKHQPVEYIELLRNEMIRVVLHPWVLILDPDERISEKLKTTLLEIAGENKFVAVNIPRKNIFFGKWIKHSNWWPDRQVRFFKKNKVRWSKRIHSYPKVDGEILNLPIDENLAIRHFGYDNFRQFINRQNRYSGVEAKNRFRKGERFSYFKFFYAPFWEFVRRYIRHLGFLDGFWGFSLSFVMTVYEMLVQVKLWELEKTSK